MGLTTPRVLRLLVIELYLFGCAHEFQVLRCCKVGDDLLGQHKTLKES